MTNQSGDTRSFAAALVGLPGMTPVRLAKILRDLEPADAWNAICDGLHPADPRRRFAAPARATDVSAVAGRYEAAGIRVLLPGSAGYPERLERDPGAPAVLFASGDPQMIGDGPAAAIVGTRSATPYGRRVASELGTALAAEGVTVVSGLALGIDGAAHAGALRGAGSVRTAPVAVVGTGLDRPYPSSNAHLWAEVTRCGVVLSESALGTPPLPRVFPARNRIIAALSDVVVVVECHHGGGSLYTAEAAARRSIPVCAVPGSVLSPASAGTNTLLVDGCTPVRDAADVLVAIALARAGSRKDTGGASPIPVTASLAASRRAREDPGRCGAPFEPTERQRIVWDAIEDTPTTIETILFRTDLPLAAIGEACEQLKTAGRLVAGAGWFARDGIASSH